MGNHRTYTKELNMENKITLTDGTEFHIIKDYLTSVELQAIIKAMRAEQDYINRQNAFDALLAGIVTDIEDFKTDAIDVDKIDDYRRRGAFKQILNAIPYEYIDIIQEGVRFEDSVEAQVYRAIEYAQIKLDELPKATKGLSTKKIIDSINALGNKMGELIKANEHLNNTMNN